MRKTAFAILFTTIGAWATGTGAAELIVSAASSLTNAFTEVGREFERANAPHKVIFNFASSGALLQQIARGAPVGVFASADQDTMDRAQERNLIVRASRGDFARNALVVVAPLDSELTLSGLEELRAERIRRIALSNPDAVPAGTYAKAALLAAGLFDALKDKYINTQSVRQSLDYVARGEVDAGFVYATDARIMADRIKVLFEVPTRTQVSYPIAVVKGNGDEALALRFIGFVMGPGGQAILTAHGFRRP